MTCRIDLDEHHVPLTVTAHVPHGVAGAGAWGIALDGLLASQVHARWKATQLARGVDLPRARHLPHPPDLDLPLARCTPTGVDGLDLWHWAATSADPTNGHDLLDDIRYWTGRHDDRAYGQLVAALPATVSPLRSRYRDRLMPLPATTCSHLTWRAVGDPQAITKLLEPITCIGRRRAAGEGRVLSWTVTAHPSTDPTAVWAHAHTHADGRLARPTPPACLHTGQDLTGAPVPHTGTGIAGIRPPYAHPDRQHSLAWPAPRHDAPTPLTPPLQQEAPA